MSHMYNGPQAFIYRLYSWLVQDCCISSADALEILQSCTKLSNQYTEMASGSSRDALSNPNLAQVCARPPTAWNNFFISWVHISLCVCDHTHGKTAHQHIFLIACQGTQWDTSTGARILFGIRAAVHAALFDRLGWAERREKQAMHYVYNLV